MILGQKKDTTPAVLEYLKVAWVLSIILITVANIKAQSTGFPDVTPHTSLLYWACVGIFAVLQVTITVLAWSRKRLTSGSIIAICLSVLALYPEYLILFFLTIIYPVVIIVALAMAIRLTTHIVKRHMRR